MYNGNFDQNSLMDKELWSFWAHDKQFVTLALWAVT